jgi:hypothetical protein
MFDQNPALDDAADNDFFSNDQPASSVSTITKGLER